MLISPEMINNEISVVYATPFVVSSPNTVQFVIATSQSQGFAWNQDIFASQYQQMCKVAFDGHEDHADTVMKRVRLLLQGGGATTLNDSVFDEEDQDMDGTDQYLSRRVSQELTRPRRRSERTISFTSDSKNGSYQRTESVTIDVGADTEENRYYKSLLSNS
ncbi:LAQU0S08e00958g1_1 [Lachancea quebecensis]|uniref:LAQU0S08e00958g1_1 n=1 Tax=Lachancea quebecensis TaxID=1654605 RepID=A0A0P1KSL9_9SACH|nr:LAQU0S08e00958g1_1 [Lachancea quebecensis]